MADHQEPHITHWLEGMNVFTQRRISFDVRNLESAEESEYGGTMIRTSTGREFHITMDYDVFHEARTELTGISVLEVKER